MCVRVPAKVNLFLAVRGVRSDGYHELSTIMQTVSVHDKLTAGLYGADLASMHPTARQWMQVDLAVEEGAPGDVPAGTDNLVMQAADALMARVGMGGNGTSRPDDGPGTSLRLTKSIPVAAGMAGGSADAAAALVLLNRLWDCQLSDRELRDLAADLGADVPFCVTGGTALATGTGAATARVLTMGTYHWVVGVTDAPLSTPEVYRAFDAHSEPSEVEPDAVLAALRTGDAEALGAALYNDLELAAMGLRPDLGLKLEAMRDASVLGTVVSGSGPTVVGLVASAEEAVRVAAAVEGSFDRVLVATSPAGGPEVSRLRA